MCDRNTRGLIAFAVNRSGSPVPLYRQCQREGETRTASFVCEPLSLASRKHTGCRLQPIALILFCYILLYS